MAVQSRWDHPIEGEAATSGAARANAVFPRAGFDVLIAIGAGALGAVLLALLTTMQLSVGLRDRIPHVPFAVILVGELIYSSPWVVLAPGIAALGREWRLESGHIIRRLPLWIVAAAVATVVQAAGMTAVRRLVGVPLVLAGPGDSEPFLIEVQERLVETFGVSVMVFVIAVLLYHALVYYGAYRDRGRREAALEAELARFRLDVLQRQLQPHFLFNALHTVSALTAEDVVAARRVLADLGDLLRISLDRMEEQEVELEKEIAFLERYIDIQTARFGDRLTVEWVIDDGARSVRVPSMILQPCVENAIQHGIEPLARGGRVVIAARVSNARLHIEIADNGPAAPKHDGRPAGRGLTNVRERLRARYGEQQSFQAGAAPGGGFLVRITLPVDDERDS